MGESARGGGDASVGWGRASPYSPSAEPLTSPFVEDESPAHAVWGSWGARQRDIFVLDRWGRLVYKENLTPGFDKVVLRRAILSALDGAPAPSLRRPDGSSHTTIMRCAATEFAPAKPQAAPRMATPGVAALLLPLGIMLLARPRR